MKYRILKLLRRCKYERYNNVIVSHGNNPSSTMNCLREKRYLERMKDDYDILRNKILEIYKPIKKVCRN